MAYNSIAIKPYYIPNNTNFIQRKNEDENEESSKSSQSSYSSNKSNLNKEEQVNQNGHKKSIQQQLIESKASHQKAVASRDAKLKDATVNIAQILKDFRNTGKAIGSSPELTEEVEMYLKLVEKQVKKENPDTKIVRSTLKNASALLDNYITATLQRPSKVVENWIDALFLQQINYSYNEGEINPQFLVKFPNRENEDEQGEENEKSEKTSVHIPKDAKLKSLFLQAKKYSYANDSQKAMEMFKLALDRAIEIEDKGTESKVLFEIGKIYDKNDYLAQALTSYNKSLSAATDVNVKTKAHYSMAQIYDDVAQFESAINHYLSSISYAGEVENLIAQSTSLVKIGNIFTDEYKNEAFDFLYEAENLVNESKNHKARGYVSGNIANAYNKFNKPQNALKYYSTAVTEYGKADLTQKVAVNYKRAAELMQDYNNTPKAKKLMQKALLKARQTDDVQLMKEIHDALAEI